MADICIFYSEPDKNKVSALSSILEDFGWSVWWDKTIKYGRWATEIELEIDITRCVVTIWNSRAIRKDSITFVETDKARTLQKPIITLISENIKPPFPFSSEHITADISKWNQNKKAKCIKNIIEGVESILGIAPKKWKGERPSMINLKGKKVKLPCFIKSLSSHETQLDPEAGITTIGLFPEVDALLISAYDMYLNRNATKKRKKQHKYICNRLRNINERGAFILLDSGNYE